ncbi:MAG: hypothetical protein GY935_16510 [Gammaproteobacteria bacterium]|jgi:hypothetical protein|nr:hypothetical protein [Gammaproteobacteria bacterium]
MTKLHMKGFVLCLLEEYREGLWDSEIAGKVLEEFHHSGDYWRGEVRATLTDLFSGALLEEVEDRLDEEEYFGADKISVKFRLSAFGRQRMVETGLL